MIKPFIFTALLFVLAACAQTQGLNTARINVDQYNKNQLERYEQSGLDEAADKISSDNGQKDEASMQFISPLSNPKERVTKKSFGIKIDPNTSPVQPERFSGYHTGVDFEILPGEEDTDVPVMAVCSGPLLQKMSVSGYGGVAVQACALDGAPVTVVYGHLRLPSIKAEVGDELKSGFQFAVLGKGNSPETDNERKHLHLGIHRGADINLLGYAQKDSDLKGWVDIMGYLK
jgi:hypothetical protein